MAFNYGTWGNSWLSSWGNSWGVRTVASPQRGGTSKRKKKKRITRYEEVESFAELDLKPNELISEEIVTEDDELILKIITLIH